MNKKEHISYDSLIGDFRKDAKFNEAYDEHDLAFEISEMLVEARIARGMTQVELAGLLKTKQSSIARAESGSRLPSLSFLQKIAEALETRLLAPRFAFLEQTSKVEVIEHTLKGLNVWPSVLSDGRSPAVTVSNSGPRRENILKSALSC